MNKLTQALKRPLEAFLQIEASSGIVLLLAAGAALVWANSPWAAAYHTLFEAPISQHVSMIPIEKSLGFIINDFLMVLFFFLVGLELKREIHSGELSQIKRAALPAFAALGGMLVPAGIYFLITGTNESTGRGWGIPMATDIAFAVGILTLLGNRVPPALRVLLLALAVIDDLGAIVVIALFYSNGISWWPLVLAAMGLMVIQGLKKTGVQTKVVYVVPSALVFFGILYSGIHPTISGVLVGLMTPASSPSQSQSPDPLGDLIHTLHRPVAYAIMPLFALSNAGVSFGQIIWSPDSSLVSWAIAAGLVIGKPLGIISATALSNHLGFASIPKGIDSKHLIVLGTVAGVGFTMSLFVAQLAFQSSPLLSAAKLAILAASGLSICLALLLGFILLKPKISPQAAPTADDAEQSTEM